MSVVINNLFSNKNQDTKYRTPRKTKRSKTLNEWKTTVILVTWYIHFNFIFLHNNYVWLYFSNKKKLNRYITLFPLPIVNYMISRRSYIVGLSHWRFSSYTNKKYTREKTN